MKNLYYGNEAQSMTIMGWNFFNSNFRKLALNCIELCVISNLGDCHHCYEYIVNVYKIYII